MAVFNIRRRITIRALGLTIKLRRKIGGGRKWTVRIDTPAGVRAVVTDKE